MDDLIQQLTYKAMDSQNYGVLFVNQTHEIFYSNHWFKENITNDLGVTNQEFLNLFPQLKQSKIEKGIQLCLESGEETFINYQTMDVPFPFVHNLKENCCLKQNVSISPIKLSHQIYAYIEVHDVSDLYLHQLELESQSIHLEKLANFDTLTGLMNRRCFTSRLDDAIASAHRNSSRFAIMFLDLDHFKEVNDKFGHSSGDELLRQVASELKKLLRRNDIIARLGGDEFVIYIDNVTREDQPAMVGNKLLSLFAQKWVLFGQEVKVGVSIGISMYPNDGMTASELLKHSDMAMYSSKQLGRGRFQYYATSMGESAFARLELERELKAAVEEGQFELYFQPQVDINQCKIHGCEALIRWNHPEKGLISPLDFIPLAEESILIVTIGRWVIEESTRFLKRLNEQGIKDILLAINLSPRQFDALSLFDVLSKAVDDTQVNAKDLVLEITEGHLLQSKAKTNLTMKRLKNLGIQIALDDFGTGYSSLAYLKTLPLDFLKIDRLFVRDLVEDKVDQQIISSIVELAQGLNLDIVAEGAETPEQVAKLKTLGCGVIQGYYYAQPLKRDDFIEYCLQFQG